jgi:hypothetical protein
MQSAMRTAHRVRLAAILALGAFALHQLRYLIAFGASSPAHLASEGHQYMQAMLPPIAIMALAAILATLIRGTEGAAPSRAPLGRRISVFAFALLGIYLVQESLEGLMYSGHLGSPAEVLGAGGWLAIPLALVIGLLAALLTRALESVERAIAVVHAERRRLRPPVVRGTAAAARGLRMALSPLAFGLARRPPPGMPA